MLKGETRGRPNPEGSAPLYGVGSSRFLKQGTSKKFAHTKKPGYSGAGGER